MVNLIVNPHPLIDYAFPKEGCVFRCALANWNISLEEVMPVNFLKLSFLLFQRFGSDAVDNLIVPIPTRKRGKKVAKGKEKCSRSAVEKKG